MTDGTAEAAVAARESAAKRRGITGPPAWAIGYRLITGWPGRAEFDQAVHRQLAVGSALDPHGIPAFHVLGAMHLGNRSPAVGSIR
jgi:hypothetical protein